MATKYDFKSYKTYPGKINESGWYVFQPLYTKLKNGKINKWTVYVRLILKADKDKVKRGSGWNKKIQGVSKILPEYINDFGPKDDEYIGLPNNVISQIWTEVGNVDGKIEIKPASYPKPTNVGKKSERDYLKQALFAAKSLWVSKRRKSGGKTKEELNQKTVIERNARYYPMLAEKFKDKKKHVKYPAMVQPKLDGVRMMFHLKIAENADPKDATIENIDVYSRTLINYNISDAQMQEMLILLKKGYDKKSKESIYLDGEFYKHGMYLQDISGIARRDEKVDSPFHIFDCFYPHELKMRFAERYELLKSLFQGTEFKLTFIVPTFIVPDEKILMRKYNEFLKQKFEGLMYRGIDSPYLSSVDQGARLRSNQLLKLKPTHRCEYKIVDFTSGKKGNAIGAIIWICETKDGKRFNVTPKGMNYDERYELYTRLMKNDKAEFKAKYYGQPMTVEYTDLAKSGVPQRAKAVGIRDYE